MQRKLYAIIDTESEYTKLIVALSYKRFLVYKRDLEKELAENNVKDGFIIVDQLLCLFDEKSRFIVLPYSDSKIDYSCVKRAIPPECCRKETIQFLHDNFKSKHQLLKEKSGRCHYMFRQELYSKV